MPGLAHIYLTAHGQWKSGTEWYGETAQMGLRIFTELTASAPDAGSVFTPSIGSDVASASGTPTGTHGTLTQTWEATGGNPVSGLLWDGTQQIDLAEDFWTFLNSVKTYQSTGFEWTHIKIAPILAAGNYGAPSSIYQFSTSIAGGTGTNVFPPEVSVALSLRAPILGRRGRGRMYLPALAGSSLTTGNGLVNSTFNSSVRGMFKTLVDNLQNASGAPYTYFPVVGVSSAGATTAVRPSEIRVGNHFDVQKRRQDQVPEIYSSTTL